MLIIVVETVALMPLRAAKDRDIIQTNLTSRIITVVVGFQVGEFYWLYKFSGKSFLALDFWCSIKGRKDET